MSIQNNTISGLWYVAIMEKQRAFLVLGANRFSDINNIEKTFADNTLSIVGLNPTKNIKIISEGYDPGNCLLQEKSLEKIGPLGISEHTSNSPYRISTRVAEELLKANHEKGCFLDASLYVVKYRDSSDRDINPFHQTAVLAKDETDLRLFIGNKRTWFGGSYTTLEKIMGNSDFRPRYGVIILPDTIIEYHKQSLKGIK
ncbi:MAG: hypothetical protein WC916_03820 [Candidatus Woesearchaeota archaeon]